MFLTIRSKDPYKAAHEIPREIAGEWTRRITLALCNAHRQEGNTTFANKFHFPLGKSGVPGLLEWIREHSDNYSWAQRFCATLANRKIKGREGRERMQATNWIACVYLVHVPPALVKRSPARPVDMDKNPLVPKNLSRAPWLELELAS